MIMTAPKLLPKSNFTLGKHKKRIASNLKCHVISEKIVLTLISIAKREENGLFQGFHSGNETGPS